MGILRWKEPEEIGKISQCCIIFASHLFKCVTQVTTNTDKSGPCCRNTQVPQVNNFCLWVTRKT